MDGKTRELIAIGASVAGHCQPCLTYHVAQARELGISEKDVREAVSVGQMVAKGAMVAMRKFADGVVSGKKQAAATCCGGTTKRGGKSCCT